ncbi:MAG: helix-turn-helix domain-containing protein [Bacteroidetes bacterium]|nr:helix-turn-helix domain-containing protein [Bacteroidota bacterium]
MGSYFSEWFPFLSVLNFTAAIQGLFLAYLLINRKSHTPEHLLLAGLVTAMSVAILGAVLGLSGYYNQFPHLIRVGDPLVLLFGPLLFGYIHILTQSKLPVHYWVHFVPFLVYIGNLIPFYALSGTEKIAFTNTYFQTETINLTALSIQITRRIHLLIYVLICLILLKKFDLTLKANFSNLEKVSLDKSRLILRLFVFLSIAGVFLVLLSFFIPLNFIVLNNLSSLFIGLVIYSLAWANWNHQPIPEIDILNPKMNVSDFKSGDSALKSRIRYTLSEEQFVSLSLKVDKLLNDDQLYLDQNLNLVQLSEKLGIQPYQTSELINRKYKESFFDLINRLRVDEIKKRLTDPVYSPYSILGIALDCGFTSKSSFNAAFKKFTGTTPSEFRVIK